MVPIPALKPHPDNPNNHPPEQIARLADIIEFQGWRYPIKVSNQSGFITTGHGRLAAAILKGWQEVPVSYQDYDSPEQEYADVVADNAIAEWAELDKEKINAKLEQLSSDFNRDLLGIQQIKVELPKAPENVNFQASAKTVFEVVIECADEPSQEAIYNQLTAQGFSCRVLSM